MFPFRMRGNEKFPENSLSPFQARTGKVLTTSAIHLELALGDSSWSGFLFIPRFGLLGFLAIFFREYYTRPGFAHASLSLRNFLVNTRDVLPASGPCSSAAGGTLCRVTHFLLLFSLLPLSLSNFSPNFQLKSVGPSFDGSSPFLARVNLSLVTDQYL
jgi:hypothetical protein